MPILELRGTLDVSQFWPDGSSDADTVRVHLDRVKYAGRVTHVLDHAVVMPIGKPVLNKRGEITVRLEGIDAPELHYRPQVRAAEENGQFRQHVAEAATLALREFLGDAQVRCRVRSAVRKPADAFDCYGRFVGDVQVRVKGRWVSINRWLVRRGWAFPAFYDSMARAEILYLRRQAAAARRRGLGVWEQYTTDADRFDPRLVFRGRRAPRRADRGRLSLPKMFRRASTWWVSKSVGSFAAYLHSRAEACFLTREFLRGTAQTRRLESFLSDHGRLQVGPGEVVFYERETSLVDRRGAEIREW